MCVDIKPKEIWQGSLSDASVVVGSEQVTVWVSVSSEGRRCPAVTEKSEPTSPKSCLVELQNKRGRFLKVTSFRRTNVPFVGGEFLYGMLSSLFFKLGTDTTTSILQ